MDSQATTAPSPLELDKLRAEISRLQAEATERTENANKLRAEAEERLENAKKLDIGENRPQT